ncbi:2-isopropylmalate synthase [Candidatus Woesearchaeota archaeon]|nr:2-isopropylmalate synthase [Candidatus Woesearchaeota archaeon]
MFLKKPKSNRVKIFDTTLRDGEQSPGASMTLEEKLAITDYLVKINVDVIEAGFPISSEDDKKAVAEIARIVPKHIEVAALARVKKDEKGRFPDIDAAYDALKECKNPRLHVFIGTSPQHIEAKFPDLGLKGVVELAKEGIRYAKKLFGKDIKIEFSPEDLARTPDKDRNYVIKQIAKEGVDVINCPDTTGYDVPHKYAKKIRSSYRMANGFFRRFFGGKETAISVHCHNDLGMATANSLEAVALGNARQIECSILGLGERGGMAALEQVVMAMRVRKDIFGEDAVPDIKTRYFFDASRELLNIIDNDMIRAPVVGDTSFAHEAGIHQHGEIKGKENNIQSVYEIMNPRDVGWKGNKFVLGKHSGWHAVEFKLNSLGYSPDSINENEAKEISREVKKLADQKKYVYDSNIDDIMIAKGKAPHINKYEVVQWISKDRKDGTPVVRIKIEGDRKWYKGKGDGLVDAAINAINEATGIKNKELVYYRSRNMGTGSDAVGKVMIGVKDSNGNDSYHNGVATGTDLFEVSIRAYTNALNRMRMYHALKK